MATDSLPQIDDFTLDLLESFANRLAAESGTMAHVMAQTGITVHDLGIDRRPFARLRLCLVPRAESLEQDIATIARAAMVTPDVVRKVVQS